MCIQYYTYLCVYPAMSVKATAVSTRVEKLFRRYMETKAFWQRREKEEGSSMYACYKYYYREIDIQKETDRWTERPRQKEGDKGINSQTERKTNQGSR